MGGGRWAGEAVGYREGEIFMRRTQRVLLLLAAAAALLTAGSSPASAVEFKVENSVYTTDQQGAEPASRSITYFTADAVCDWMKEPAEVSIFDESAKRITLISVTNRTRTELSTADIETIVQKLEELATKNSDPLVKFCATPAFQKSFDKVSKEATFRSEWITYRLVLAPEADAEVVEKYRQSCDWLARLKFVLYPGSLPPAARIVVNQEMALQQAIPSQVFLTITSSKPGLPPTTFRSEHRIMRPLSETDHERLSHLRGALKDFKLVTFDQYRKAKDQTKNPAEDREKP